MILVVAPQLPSGRGFPQSFHATQRWGAVDGRTDSVEPLHHPTLHDQQTRTETSIISLVKISEGGLAYPFAAHCWGTHPCFMVEERTSFHTYSSLENTLSLSLSVENAQGLAHPSRHGSLTPSYRRNESISAHFAPLCLLSVGYPNFLVAHSSPSFAKSRYALTQGEGLSPCRTRRFRTSPKSAPEPARRRPLPRLNSPPGGERGRRSYGGLPGRPPKQTEKEEHVPWCSGTNNGNDQQSNDTPSTEVVWPCVLYMRICVRCVLLR